jgi:hypothetical protein
MRSQVQHQYGNDESILPSDTKLSRSTMNTHITPVALKIANASSRQRYSPTLQVIRQKFFSVPSVSSWLMPLTNQIIIPEETAKGGTLSDSPFVMLEQRTSRKAD